MKTKTDKNKIVLRVTIAFISTLLVSTILIQFKSVDEYRKSNIESLREDELKTQVATYKSKYEEAQEQLQSNQNKIDEYKNTADENAKSSELIEEELAQSNDLLGLTDVKGEGVILTLIDTDENRYTSENIRTLINELKYAGAEAISINGNRVINLADIVTINDTFIVMNGGSIRLDSPYEIKAIGDRKYLTSTLNMKNSGFVDLMKSSNLEILVKESESITINKYNGSIKNEYIKEDE
ncbi:MAG: DUF881 domain-containing protein [Clostridia bacterium]|nr:DUF881 domain-containing protein [Clostridia bacterium]